MRRSAGYDIASQLNPRSRRHISRPPRCFQRKGETRAAIARARRGLSWSRSRSMALHPRCDLSEGRQWPEAFARSTAPLH